MTSWLLMGPSTREAPTQWGQGRVDVCNLAAQAEKLMTSWSLSKQHYHSDSKEGQNSATYPNMYWYAIPSIGSLLKGLAQVICMLSLLLLGLSLVI
ncbi:hypothetical protein Lal_00046875 [Lupinus albus]|nr:hypothetical protein Lal_00046875 [Lupinus albus]